MRPGRINLGNSFYRFAYNIIFDVCYSLCRNPTGQVPKAEIRKTQAMRIDFLDRFDERQLREYF